MALTRLPDAELTDGEVQLALLDRSTRVRDTARWRAGRRGMDVPAVYREVLTADRFDGASPRTVVASLAGLGWVGDTRDVAAIELRLDDARPSVRAAAVRALTARTDPGEKIDRLGGLLLDSSPRVATAAAQALAVVSPAATSAAEELAWASAQLWSRRAAWRLGHEHGGWARVEADLRAAAEPDPALAELGRTSLLNWLTTSAATTWQRPTAGQIDRLAELLPAAGLDADTARLVAFHAGLPWHQDHAAEPPGGRATTGSRRPAQELAGLVLTTDRVLLGRMRREHAKPSEGCQLRNQHALWVATPKGVLDERRAEAAADDHRGRAL